MYRHSEAGARFELAVPGEGNPVEIVVRFLAESQVIAIAPRRSDLSTAKWGVRTSVVRGGTSPVRFLHRRQLCRCAFGEAIGVDHRTLAGQRAVEDG